MVFHVYELPNLMSLYIKITDGRSEDIPVQSDLVRTEVSGLTVFHCICFQLEQEYDSDEKKKRRKKKHDREETDSSDEDDEDDRPKKRGRPRTMAKESVKGFTDSEIRRFIKSFKKFGHPMTR